LAIEIDNHPPVPELHPADGLDNYDAMTHVNAGVQQTSASILASLGLLSRSGFARRPEWTGDCSIFLPWD